MLNINDVCDYLINRFSESNESLSNLKLQKLLYYIQAWYLAFYNKPLFNSKFQAWIHGPVSRDIYNRFSSKNLYSSITSDDIKDSDFINRLDSNHIKHINVVLESYGGLADYQLEEMSHQEEPWLSAREGYRPSQRCEVTIEEEIMTKYYKMRISD